MSGSSLRPSTGLLWLGISAQALAADKRLTLVLLLVLGFASLLLLSEMRVGKQRFNLSLETGVVLLRPRLDSQVTESVLVGELRLRAATWEPTGEPLPEHGVTLSVEPGGLLTLHAIRVAADRVFGAKISPDGWVQLDMSEVDRGPIVVSVEPPATMTLGYCASPSACISAIHESTQLEVWPAPGFSLSFRMADERPLRLAQAVSINRLAFDDDNDPTEGPFSRLRSGVLQFDLWGGRPDTALQLRDGETLALSGENGHLRHLVVVAEEWEPGAARALQLEAVGEVSGAKAGFRDRRDRELRPSLLENLVSWEPLRIFGGVALSIGVALIGLWKLRDSAKENSGTSVKRNEPGGSEVATQYRDAAPTHAAGQMVSPPDGSGER